MKRLIKISFLSICLAALITGGPLASGQYSSPEAEINALNLKIQEQKKQLEAVQAKQKEYQEKIAAKQKDKANLQNQLSILDDSLTKSQLDIEAVSLEISQASLELKKVEMDIAGLDEKIEKQKEHISSLLRLVYKQDQVSTLEMLLLNGSLSEFMNQAKYLADANEEIGRSVEDLRQDKEGLESNQALMKENKEKLDKLKDQLEEKQSNLAYEQQNKVYLLEETKSSEKEYQSLLQQAKREQQQINAEIASVEALIREKMSQQEKNRLESGNNTIAWPVPKNYITSTFHDPDYPYRNIIGEHPAIDIRAGQGTTIRAAADGYVAKVRYDGSKSYAYIMIIHGDGLSTVYGHVSAVYVSPDQYVVQGQTIGRSGGTPGTPGSGPFSSGPHLHFEVRKDGLPVNPLNYLP